MRMSAAFPLRRFASILFIIGAIAALVLCYSMDYFHFHRPSSDTMTPRGPGNRAESLEGFHSEGTAGNAVNSKRENKISFVPSRVRGERRTIDKEYRHETKQRTGADLYLSAAVVERTRSTTTTMATRRQTRPETASTRPRQRTKISIGNNAEMKTVRAAQPAEIARLGFEVLSTQRPSRTINVVERLEANRARQVPVVRSEYSKPVRPVSRITSDSKNELGHLESDPNRLSRTSVLLKVSKPNVARLKPKPTPRPRACDGCMRHEFRVLIQAPPCDSRNPPELLFVVISSPDKSEMRNAIRNSWGKSRGGQVKLVFLFGRPKDPAYEATLLDENETYHDILQEDFVDSYGNLTFKTMMAFKFVKNHCQNAKYVFKTDDDMWVNVPQFFDAVEHVDMSNSVGGMCIMKAAPIRDTRSKWYASYLNYPQNKYPGFCTGTAYFMKARTAVRLFDVSPNVPFFYLEDIYVSLCAEKARVQLKPVEGFHNYRVAPGSWCGYKRGTLITSHGVSGEELILLENLIC